TELFIALSHATYPISKVLHLYLENALRFFFAVGKRNEVPPRTVANSAKNINEQGTREAPKSRIPKAPPPPAPAKPQTTIV
ncbi:hypothetical protein, partial [Caballeronia sordidicola]|uniref:hypothetical protein n=1 Tax=Caballeronia sordidicola TaxID=196367 RepID=UPI001ABF442D